ncbi:trypsin-like peptidase domain-containing protein [Algivirga pacifica]|uniref:Trypsin-like peptidase domain-containing protein n=1 Tax=Algivirga pacifica TaxID=1162670 RepID=A0ABP9DCF7_9BACT
MRQFFMTVFLSLSMGLLGAYLYEVWSESAQEKEVQAYLSNHNMTGADVVPLTYSSDRDWNRVKEGESTKNIPVSFVEAAENATRSVVYIKTFTDRSSYSGGGTWLDLFFDRRSSGRGQLGSGSGVIYSADGYVVTNNHVVKGADRIEVVYQKRTYSAELKGIDPSTDLALLKIEADNLPSIRVASSRAVSVGDWVLAVGNPFNLATTVTAGIVSAKGRKINILKDLFPIESFIQTDAAINPGNSGGALVNTDGDLVGINTAILSKTGSYAGYGFAVPSDIMVKVVNDIIQYGAVQKAFLGAEVAEIDENISRQLQLKSLEGVVIFEVEEGGGAAKAGLKKGDVIKKIDNYTILTEADYAEQLSFYAPGDQVTVNYLRKGALASAKLTLTNVEGGTGIARKKIYNASNIGAKFETVPKLERTRLGIDSGIRILGVDRGGLIDRMDLYKGEIIVSINRFPINEAKDFSEILEQIRGRVILEVLNRNGQRKYYSYIF